MKPIVSVGSPTPTTDYYVETPGGLDFSQWQEIPPSRYWHIVSTTEPVDIQWNNLTLPLITRSKARGGELVVPVKRFRIRTNTAQTVQISFGDALEWDVADTANVTVNVPDPLNVTLVAPLPVPVQLVSPIPVPVQGQTAIPFNSEPVLVTGHQDTRLGFALTTPFSVPVGNYATMRCAIPAFVGGDQDLFVNDSLTSPRGLPVYIPGAGWRADGIVPPGTTYFYVACQCAINASFVTAGTPWGLNTAYSDQPIFLP